MNRLCASQVPTRKCSVNQFDADQEVMELLSGR